MPPGVSDRTVRITGQDVEQLMRAVALILTKLAQVCHWPPSLGSCDPLEPETNGSYHPNCQPAMAALARGAHVCLHVVALLLLVNPVVHASVCVLHSS